MIRACIDDVKEVDGKYSVTLGVYKITNPLTMAEVQVETWDSPAIFDTDADAWAAGSVILDEFEVRMLRAA